MNDEFFIEGVKGVGVGLVFIKFGDGVVVVMYGGKDVVKNEYNDVM